MTCDSLGAAGMLLLKPYNELLKMLFTTLTQRVASQQLITGFLQTANTLTHFLTFCRFGDALPGGCTPRNIAHSLTLKSRRDSGQLPLILGKALLNSLLLGTRQHGSAHSLNCVKGGIFQCGLCPSGALRGAFSGFFRTGDSSFSSPHGAKVAFEGLNALGEICPGAHRFQGCFQRHNTLLGGLSLSAGCGLRPGSLSIFLSEHLKLLF